MSTTFPVCRPLVGDASLTTTCNSELVEEFLRWKRSYTSAAHRVYRVWAFRFQEFVNKPPELLRHTDYIDFAETLRNQYSSGGIELALSVVHNYLKFFAELGRLRFPLFLTRVPRGVPNPHETIEESEYRKLISMMQSLRPVPLRDLVMIMLLHDTGMRIGELLSLSIDDIESDKSAAIRTEKTCRRRRVFWNEDTELFLQRYLVERVNRGPTQSDTLFASPSVRNQKALTSRSVQRMMKVMLSRAAIKRRLSPHSFRHAFIHRLAKLGIPDAIIAQLIGHSTPGTIARYTVLSRPEFKQFAAKQLEFANNECLQLAA